MNVIYQPADEDVNLFEAQARELDAERNHSILTSPFRTIPFTRQRLEEGKLPAFHQC